FILLISIKLNPSRFVLNFFQAVRRVAVHANDFARLRIENDDSAVLAFELVNDGLLHLVMNGELHILRRPLLHILPEYDLQSFRNFNALNAEERALKSGIASVR